jgi:UDP-galactopyranose mutase
MFTVQQGSEMMQSRTTTPHLRLAPAQGGSSLICFSHLRWDFVFQRPQHLMSRFAQNARVTFWEEPQFSAATEPSLAIRRSAESGVTVAVPQLPHGMNRSREIAALRGLLDTYVSGLDQDQPLIRWYYTPMMLPFSAHVDAACVVYDCMDELASFQGAPPELLALESQLMREADLVFTGGYGLYEAKRERHSAVYPFPSSVDVAHFARARAPGVDPADQSVLLRPRLGFYGVIDERMDLDLLAALADARPDWSLVIIGPVVKISEASLPVRPNLHYLGGKSYAELPDYLRGWDVALMPFAINEATRFISPTKTPEYLAAGKPVVSTSITDVVKPYGREGLAWIADTAGEFAAAIDEALRSDHTARRAHADAFLSGMSWDRTWAGMWSHVQRAIEARALRSSGLVATAPGAGAGAQVVQARRSAED